MPASPTSPQRIAVAERRRKVLELRKAGLSFQAIVDRHPDLGYKSKGAAAQDAKRALHELLAEPARDVLALELARLDGLMEQVWLNARKGNLHAVDKALRIMERRAKYLGLDYADRNVEASDAAEQKGALGDIAAAIREAAAQLDDDEQLGEHLNDDGADTDGE